MKSIDEMLDDILRREGGFVAHSADKGGATNMGISLRYARGVGLDLNNDGTIDERDIEMVTEDVARECFRRDFLETPRIDRLPAELHPQMFDIAVLSGPHRAIELLQRCLNRFGAQVDEDGGFGPKTRKAAEAACADRGWVIINNALVDERILFFRRICDRDVSQRVFLRGWTNRAEEFRVH